MKKILILLITGAILATASSCQQVSAGNTMISESSLLIALPTSLEETTETAIVTETTKVATPTPTEKPTVNPTVTPTTVPETSATTVATTTAATTAKQTEAPTQPTQTTAPATTTAAPPPTTATTTAAPTESTPAPTTFVENPDVICEGIIQYAKDNGVWYPDGEVKGSDEMSFSLGYFNSNQKYIDVYDNGKIIPEGNKWYGIVSVSCWIENGWIYISSEVCSLPES